MAELRATCPSDEECFDVEACACTCHGGPPEVWHVHVMRVVRTYNTGRMTIGCDGCALEQNMNPLDRREL